MTCRELADFLDEYVDGTLQASRRFVFEEHLRGCADCTNYLNSYVRTMEMGRRAAGEPQDAAPLAVPGDLIKAVIAARGLK